MHLWHAVCEHLPNATHSGLAAWVATASLPISTQPKHNIRALRAREGAPVRERSPHSRRPAATFMWCSNDPVQISADACKSSALASAPIATRRPRAYASGRRPADARMPQARPALHRQRGAGPGASWSVRHSRWSRFGRDSDGPVSHLSRAGLETVLRQCGLYGTKTTLARRYSRQCRRWRSGRREVDPWSPPGTWGHGRHHTLLLNSLERYTSTVQSASTEMVEDCEIDAFAILIKAETHDCVLKHAGVLG